ncbi:hypothetical protein TNCV_2225251 [Trichonephila clavipes]|nr:hypothetical protein TNCV_2225251 [Trichonephila clavipes]
MVMVTSSKPALFLPIKDSQPDANKDHHCVKDLMFVEAQNPHFGMVCNFSQPCLLTDLNTDDGHGPIMQSCHRCQLVLVRNSTIFRSICQGITFDEETYSDHDYTEDQSRMRSPRHGS